MSEVKDEGEQVSSDEKEQETVVECETAQDDENDESEQEGTQERVVPVSMKGFTIVQIIACIEEEIERCRAKLEYEPSGRVLAHLQGKIPGCNFALEAMREIFNLNDDFFGMIEKPVVLSQLSREEILGIVEDMEELQKTEEWQKFLNKIQTKTDELKDFLLFKAKKSRDFDVSQGDYAGMVIYQKLFDSIKDNSKFWDDSLFRREQKEECPRDANEQSAVLLPPGLPAPEDDEIEIDYDDTSEGDDVSDDSNADPDMEMGDGE